MHTDLILGTTLAAAALAYALKPRKPKTELEAQSVPVPVAPTYLPFQIDGVLHYILSTLAGKDEMEYLRNMTGRIGNTLNFRGFNQDFYIVLDPSSIQHILAKNQPNYEKGNLPCITLVQPRAKVFEHGPLSTLNRARIPGHLPRVPRFRHL